jgi:hypothetical protein
MTTETRSETRDEQVFLRVLRITVVKNHNLKKFFVTFVASW